MGSPSPVDFAPICACFLAISQIVSRRLQRVPIECVTIMRFRKVRQCGDLSEKIA